MQKKIATVFTTLAYLHSLLGPTAALAAGANPPITLTQGQKDDLVSMDLLDKHPEAANRATAIGMAVHYENNRYTGIPDFRELERAENFSLGNPLSAATYKSLFSSPYKVPPTREEALGRVAQQVFENTEPIKIRNSLGARTVDLATGAGVLAAPFLLNPLGAAGVAGGKLVFDFAKEFAIDEDEKRTRSLPHSRAQTIATLSRMQNEIRNETAEGRAIADTYKKLLNDDPKEDSDTKTPIQSAKFLLTNIQNEKNREKSLVDNGRIDKALEKLSNGVAVIRQKVDEQAEYAKQQEQRDQQQAANAEAEKQKNAQKALQEQRRIETYRDMQNVRGSLMVAGYLMEIAGDKENARIAMGTADAVDKVSNLVSQAANMAPMMLAAGYIGVAIAVVSLIQQANQPKSPYPAIFAMLQQLSKQINDLRADMLSSMGNMDNRLGNLLVANLELTDAVKRDTEALRVQLNDIQTQLQGVQELLVSQNAALQDLFLSAEDRACIRIENRHLLEPKPDFLSCQDIYLHRATVVAADAISNSQLSEKTASYVVESHESFPFGGRYQTLKQDLQMPGSAIANPNVWAAAVSRYLLLLRNFPEYLKKIDLAKTADDYESLTLDPMIGTGESIREFTRSVAFVKNSDSSKAEVGFSLNRASFEKLISELQQNYQSVLSQLAQELSHTGVHGDITHPSAQQKADPNFAFHFLAGNNVGFCPYKGAGVHVLSAKSISTTRAGGGGGIDENVFEYKDTLRSAVNDQMKNHPASEFQPDASILSKISDPVRLWEMVQPGNYVDVCLQSLDIANLEFSKTTQVQADISVRYFVSVNINGVRTVVEELFGTRHITTPFFNYYYTAAMSATQIRDALLAQKISEQLHGHYGEFIQMKLHPGEDKAIEQVDFILGQKQSELRSRLVYKAQADRIEQLRTNLIMLTAIGLNLQNRQVDELVRRFEDTIRFPTASSLIDSAVLKGLPLADLNKTIKAEIKSTRQKITDLAALPAGDIVADTTVLELKINQLKILKDLRIQEPSH